LAIDQNELDQFLANIGFDGTIVNTTAHISRLTLNKGAVADGSYRFIQVTSTLRDSNLTVGFTDATQTAIDVFSTDLDDIVKPEANYFITVCECRNVTVPPAMV